MICNPFSGALMAFKRSPNGHGQLVALLFGLMLISNTGSSAGWQPLGARPLTLANTDLAYAEASAKRESDDLHLSAHLAFFRSRAYRFEVVDLPPPTPLEARPRIDAALRAADIAAGVNGGFFHANGRPLGLVIADGHRINRLERAKLLSGVLYSDQEGNHLLRFARFVDHPGIHALLQTGPYLVEHGRAVRGLSNDRPARRSFAATDWRGNWMLGATRQAISLADLAECLATPGMLSDWPIERAINLDGGSSTGFYFAARSGQSAVVVQPLKPVRNLLGIVPRAISNEHSPVFEVKPIDSNLRVE